MARRLHTQFRQREILAAISGFVLMAYELIAARILAPTIGTSTYVWTSVIGVIIAALSIGYFVGGKLADRRHKEVDLAWLHLAAAAAVIWTLLAAPGLLGQLSMTGADARLQGVLASLVLFVPASLLLGAISPYLVKLQVTSLDTSGSSVARLSALNSIGGIGGTFVTGFILFSWIGARESLLLCVLLLLVASWLSVPRTKAKVRAIITGILLLVGLLALGTQTVFAIDTPSAHYEIRETRDDRPIRLLRTGPNGAQSGVYTTGKNELAFWYTQQLARLVAEAPKKDTILVLGGGAFTVPDYLATTYPQSQVDTVEIDPGLQAIARQYFRYSDQPNATTIAGDARSYANQTTKTYDIVIVDVYSDTSVPFSLLTREYAESLDRLTGPEGTVLVNAIGALSGGCQPLLASMDAAYRSQFAYAEYESEYPTAPSSNMILQYARQPRTTPGLDALPLQNGRLYTDNFMPAERLQQACLSAR